MPSARIWLSFDLGAKGDYKSLYSWLDARRARECAGSSVATLNFVYEHNLAQELEAAIESEVEIGERDRIYLIYPRASDSQPRGRWLFGRRRASPWIGYGPEEGEEVDE